MILTSNAAPSARRVLHGRSMPPLCALDRVFDKACLHNACPSYRGRELTPTSVEAVLQATTEACSPREVKENIS